MPPAAHDSEPVSEAVLDALGDPTRRKILRLLREEPQAITELAGRLPVSRPAVSKHLGKLRAASLVSHEIHGRRHVYTLRSDGFAQAHEYLDSFWDVVLRRFKLVADRRWCMAPD